MILVRERAILFSYQFAICTDRRQLSTCFEIARFIRICRDNFKPLDHRYEVVSHGRILFDFVSIEASTSGDVEFFTFVFIVKGLFAFLGYFAFITTLGKPASRGRNFQTRPLATRH